MALSHRHWSECRSTLRGLLSSDGPDARLRSDNALRKKALLPRDGMTMYLPADIGDYTGASTISGIKIKITTDFFLLFFNRLLFFPGPRRQHRHHVPRQGQGPDAQLATPPGRLPRPRQLRGDQRHQGEAAQRTDQARGRRPSEVRTLQAARL